MLDYLINDGVSFFLLNRNEINYVNTAHLHKFFIDKNNGGRLLLSIFYMDIPLFDKFDTIELRYIHYSNREDYHNSDLLARIVDCDIKQKWFSDMVINDPILAKDLVNLYMYIKGKIEIINLDIE